MEESRRLPRKHAQLLWRGLRVQAAVGELRVWEQAPCETVSSIRQRQGRQVEVPVNDIRLQTVGAKLTSQMKFSLFIKHSQMLFSEVLEVSHSMVDLLLVLYGDCGKA